MTGAPGGGVAGRDFGPSGWVPGETTGSSAVGSPETGEMPGCGGGTVKPSGSGSAGGFGSSRFARAGRLAGLTGPPDLPTASASGGGPFFFGSARVELGEAEEPEADDEGVGDDPPEPGVPPPEDPPEPPVPWARVEPTKTVLQRTDVTRRENGFIAERAKLGFVGAKRLAAGR